MRQWGITRGRLAALQEHRVARRMHSCGVEPHRHRRHAGCAGPADAVLIDRFAVSMTADVDAQRVAVAQQLATVSRKTSSTIIRLGSED